VGQGEIVALVGANGAGKTTTMKAISGLVRPQAGAVVLDGEALTRFSTMEIVGRGVLHVPEGRKLFPEMTVRDNLLLGGFTRAARPCSRSGWRGSSHALAIAHRGFVLESGRVVLAGTGAQLLADPKVREAYLGL
jgi:branched-chain amino acid transport system ATP-binding protein